MDIRKHVSQWNVSIDSWWRSCPPPPPPPHSTNEEEIFPSLRGGERDGGSSGSGAPPRPLVPDTLRDVWLRKTGATGRLLSWSCRLSKVYRCIIQTTPVIGKYLHLSCKSSEQAIFAFLCESAQYKEIYWYYLYPQVSMEVICFDRRDHKMIQFSFSFNGMK